MLVTFKCSRSAKIQPTTIDTKATAVIHSSRDRDPKSANALRAAAGASGVSPTPGGNKRASNQGNVTIATSAGTQAAMSHFPNPTSKPYSFATCTAIGFADVAVIQRADDTAKLAMPQNIRYPPRRRPSGLSGSDPDPRATERTMGKSTPPRAVLLGNAGAMAASVSTMLYASPIEERPKRLTIKRLMRCPSPDFTTACATRNATTTSSTLVLANPANAFAGEMVPVITTAATASVVEVSSGNAPIRTA